MALLPSHRDLLLGQALGGLLLNIPLNGALAWFTVPKVATLPLWARGNCVAGDVIGTSFFLPLCTCLVLTALLRPALRAGRLPGLPRAALPWLLRRWPHNLLGRGALVGLLCALTFAPLCLALLSSAGVTQLDRAQVTWLKAIYTGLLGLVVTPLFGWRALAEGSAAPTEDG